jgi:hypothetical protein
MGLFDFFKNKVSTTNDTKASDSLESINITGWTDVEKALLFAVLEEISYADGELHGSEKAVLFKKLFGVGVLDDIMHIQSLKDKIYEQDLEKIANDFNKLSSKKKEYIIAAASELMKADGTVSLDELLIANKLTGDFSEQIPESTLEEKMTEVESMLKAEFGQDLSTWELRDDADTAFEAVFPGNLTFDNWICSDGSEAPISNFKEVVCIQLGLVAVQKEVLNTNSETEAFIETYDGRKIYDWFPLKAHLAFIKNQYSQPPYDQVDLMMALEALRACVFDFGQMKRKRFFHLIAFYLIQDDEINDEKFLKAYRMDQFETLTEEN